MTAYLSVSRSSSHAFHDKLSLQTLAFASHPHRIQVPHAPICYTATLGAQPILLCLRKISDAQAESDLSLLLSRIREPTARELCGAVQIMPWTGQTQPGCDVGPSATDYLKDKYILLAAQQPLYTIPLLTHSSTNTIQQIPRINMSKMSSQVEPTIVTAVETAPVASSSSEPSSTSNSANLRRGSRAAPPEGLNLSPANKLAPPTAERQDFPSPGAAPAGQRIFDANAVAEDRGVETVPGGWAKGVDQQDEVAEEYEKQDDPTHKSSPSLKQKVKNLLHRD
jgi:hypothetical protein